jgi:hypothetical protein
VSLKKHSEEGTVSRQGRRLVQASEAIQKYVKPGGIPTRDKRRGRKRFPKSRNANEGKRNQA